MSDRFIDRPVTKGCETRLMKFLRSGGLFLTLLCLQAQVNRTAITGTVTDQQGNRVPQASVRAIQSVTGLRRETSTTSQGTYELPNLPPGIYSLQITKTGFSSIAVERVEQVVGQTRTPSL